MPNNCIVQGCKSTSTNKFPFPVDRPDINARWISAIAEYQLISPDYATFFVCSAHFISNDFLEEQGMMRLASNAVPSVFPRLQVSSLSNRNIDNFIKDEPMDIEDLPNSFANSETYSETDEEGTEGEQSETPDNEEESQEYLQNLRGEIQTVENTDTLEVVDTDEDLDSDYEPVTEQNVFNLQEKLSAKTQSLKRNQATLQSMLEMIKNQASTIEKLEAELNVAKERVENSVQDEGSTLTKGNTAGVISEAHGYTSDLQIFAISLYYFSPTVYAYICSIIPNMPPKSVIVDWIKCGRVLSIFPPDAIAMEKFCFD